MAYLCITQNAFQTLTNRIQDLEYFQNFITNQPKFHISHRLINSWKFDFENSTLVMNICECTDLLSRGYIVFELCNDSPNNIYFRINSVDCNSDTCNNNENRCKAILQHILNGYSSLEEDIIHLHDLDKKGLLCHNDEIIRIKTCSFYIRDPRL